MNKTADPPLADDTQRKSHVRHGARGRFLVFPIAVGVLVAFDILLKVWAVENLMGQPNLTLLSGILGLTYHENTGVAFGLGAGQAWGQWVFSGLKMVIIAGLVWFYFRRLPFERRHWVIRVPIILIIAGGIGNLIDRMTLGHVRDMLMFEFINFPIFNLADVYVVVGCFTMAFVTLFIMKEFP